MAKNAIIVNLFAGPGTGKSTTATGVFSKLKMLGVDCEYAPEFAKDCVWEEREKTFTDQLYIMAKQNHRIQRLNDAVDVVITDSPVLLSCYYGKDDKELCALTAARFHQYDNVNYFLKRVKEYNPNGRNQTEAEAKVIDGELKFMLESYDIDYTEVVGDDTAIDTIVKDVMKRLGREEPHELA